MRKAIIFSTYILNNEALWIGEKFITLFREHYSDYDIYIGNNSPCDEWINLLKNINDLNIFYETTSKDIEIDSDVSGFQTALKLLKNKKNSYDIYFFMHTKSVTSKCFDFLQEVFNDFLIKNKDIEFIFKNDNVGAYFPYYGLSAKEWINNCLNTILPKTNHDNSGYTSLYTFYVINGNIIKWFFENVDGTFFDKKITDFTFFYNDKLQNFDRYFFERDFPMIYEKLNYKLEYKKKCF
jgi:hypothetical protein